MIKGFSKLSKKEKREFVVSAIKSEKPFELFNKLELNDSEIQELIEGFSENTISTYSLPYSIVPNFLVNRNDYIVPMVTEESSVVAAVASSAKFWYTRGGFHAEVLGAVKSGQIHFKWRQNQQNLIDKFVLWEKELTAEVAALDEAMIKRGGGIKAIDLIDKTNIIPDYYQVNIDFDTQDAMGANYMNSCLESLAGKMEQLAEDDTDIKPKDFSVIMAILSNYSPENSVKVSVECVLEQLVDDKTIFDPVDFANKFKDAVEIAKKDINRAVTHNKGIFNGIDALSIATGNDWRAIEANGHAFASRDGIYRSLSSVSIENNIFRFEAIIPMQVGTVGGVTSLHPMADFSLNLLNKPSANYLMQIIGCVGLASNFAAIRSLITTGIQKGHMKMHLNNILNGLNASMDEKREILNYFKDKSVSYNQVKKVLSELRQI